MAEVYASSDGCQRGIGRLRIVRRLVTMRALYLRRGIREEPVSIKQDHDTTQNEKKNSRSSPARSMRLNVTRCVDEVSATLACTRRWSLS